MISFNPHAVWLLSLVLARVTLIQAYRIRNSYVGYDFYDLWTWETRDDPTHGYVDYVDKWTAISSGLSYATIDKFVMRVDSTHVVDPNARGRASVRIISNAATGDSVTVLDLAHMPEGCGTWPAFWTLSATGPWPNGGEIDIIEGVHRNTQNLASLHTIPGCTIEPSRSQGGAPVSSNCDTSVNYNQGCGTSFRKANSYGSQFNDADGGWYVMERNRKKGVSVWFWSRYDSSVPGVVKYGSPTLAVDSSWGVPDATFPVDSCDYDSVFDDHKMIFDTTFCGDWAGATWPNSGCGPGSCNDYVRYNPAAFEQTYWEINSLRVYT